MYPPETVEAYKQVIFHKQRISEELSNRNAAVGGEGLKETGAKTFLRQRNEGLHKGPV